MLAAAAHTVAVLIEAAGSALLVGFVLGAGAALLRGEGPERARLLIAEGAVLALSFKTGATLLKTLDLPDWNRIAAFAVILALRTALKRAFSAEQAALTAGPTGRPDRREPGAGLWARTTAHFQSRAAPRANPSADLQ